MTEVLSNWLDCNTNTGKESSSGRVGFSNPELALHYLERLASKLYPEILTVTDFLQMSQT